MARKTRVKPSILFKTLHNTHICSTYFLYTINSYISCISDYLESSWELQLSDKRQNV